MVSALLEGIVRFYGGQRGTMIPHGLAPAATPAIALCVGAVGLTLG